MPRTRLTRLLFLILTIPLAITSLWGQTTNESNPETKSDTSLIKKQSPSKAALYSAVLPGLGQAYNKKYWKIPVIYTGFGVMTYFIVSNNKEYNKFNDAYKYKTGDTIGGSYNEYVDRYDAEELQAGKDYYRRNRDFSIIITSVWYLLNIIDASVDAYLFDYDVSDDLSLRVAPEFSPMLMNTPVPAELRLTFKLGAH